MSRFTGIAIFLVLVSPLTFAAENPSPKPGQLASKVTCSRNVEQTYALYVPSQYSDNSKWPIIYAFDPGARGEKAVEAIRAAAEQYGYIVAASNNSRNGSFGGSSEAANAVFQDTHERFAIDDRRVYTAGLSGGARLATEIALLCKTCVAGVIANGAGFPVSRTPSKEIGFAYFLGIGNADFNFPEGVDLRRQLEQVHARFRIRNFEGGHDWAPPDVWKEALGWMKLQAIRNGTLPKNAKDIQEIFQEELEIARADESKGNILAATREYEYIIRDFDGLTDIGSQKQRAVELRSSKEFKTEEKQERSDVERQVQLDGQASAKMQGIATNDTDLTTYAGIKTIMADLKTQVAKAANPNDPNVLVARRALGQLVVQAYESGDTALEAKNYPAALKYFDLVAAGAKSEGGARYERARVYAAQGDLKKCLSELKQAQSAGFHEPAALDAAEFKPYRQLPEFQSLAAEWNKQAQP